MSKISAGIPLPLPTDKKTAHKGLSPCEPYVFQFLWPKVTGGNPESPACPWQTSPGISLLFHLPPKVHSKVWLKNHRTLARANDVPQLPSKGRPFFRHAGRTAVAQLPTRASSGTYR